jgi:hypothetical protein
MKVGDIVYFKSTYTARYSDRSQSGSYEYHFCPGDRYRIDEIRDNLYTNNRKTGTITNLEDGTSHFAHSEIWNRLITKEEWREIQLNKIGI